MSAHNGMLQRVLDALNEVGPMTASELATYLQLPLNKVSARLVCLRRKTPWQPEKRIHIHDWIYDDDESLRRYPRAVYRAGPGSDKTKPRAKTPIEKNREQRAKRKPLKVTMSAFNPEVFNARR